jgi:uncharacterized RmlC-like cupin family protein
LAQSHRYLRYYLHSGRIHEAVSARSERELNLKAGDVYVAKAARPHLVTNGGTKSLTFSVLQGIGEYDYVPLKSK